MRLIHAIMAFCQYVSHNVLRNKQIELNVGVRLIHSRWSLVKFMCLSFSIDKLCDEVLNLANAIRYSVLF